jgi:hypothetical protein
MSRWLTVPNAAVPPSAPSVRDKTHLTQRATDDAFAAAQHRAANRSIRGRQRYDEPLQSARENVAATGCLEGFNVWSYMSALQGSNAVEKETSQST